LRELAVRVDGVRGGALQSASTPPGGSHYVLIRKSRDVECSHGQARRSRLRASSPARFVRGGIRLEAMVIDWDGRNVPPELHVLPPGRYVLSPLDDDDELSAEEDAAIREGLDDVEAGRVVSLEQVIQEFESRLRRP